MVRLTKLGQWHDLLGVAADVRAPFKHDVSLRTMQASRAVRSYISKPRRILGDHFTCMMAVLAAKRLLARKNVNCSVFIGIKFTRDEPSSSRKFEAHSWLIHGDYVVAGHGDIKSFRIIKRFD